MRYRQCSTNIVQNSRWQCLGICQGCCDFIYVENWMDAFQLYFKVLASKSSERNKPEQEVHSEPPFLFIYTWCLEKQTHYMSISHYVIWT